MIGITKDFSRSVDLGNNLSSQYHGVTLGKCPDSSLKSSFMPLIRDVTCAVKGVFIIYNWGWYRRETNLIEKNSATQLFG